MNAQNGVAETKNIINFRIKFLYNPTYDISSFDKDFSYANICSMFNLKKHIKRILKLNLCSRNCIDLKTRAFRL